MYYFDYHLLNGSYFCLGVYEQPSLPSHDHQLWDVFAVSRGDKEYQVWTRYMRRSTPLEKHYNKNCHGELNVIFVIYTYPPFPLTGYRVLSQNLQIELVSETWHALLLEGMGKRLFSVLLQRSSVLFVWLCFSCCMVKNPSKAKAIK